MDPNPSPKRTRPKEGNPSPFSCHVPERACPFFETKATPTFSFFFPFVYWNPRTIKARPNPARTLSLAHSFTLSLSLPIRVLDYCGVRFGHLIERLWSVHEDASQIEKKSVRTRCQILWTSSQIVWCRLCSSRYSNPPKYSPLSDWFPRKRRKWKEKKRNLNFNV
jgi:hypothetical protein